jgi:hypothetical protein
VLKGGKKPAGVRLWICSRELLFTAEVEKSGVSYPDIPALVAYGEPGIACHSLIFTEKSRIYSIYKKIIKNALKRKKGLA